MANSSKNPYQPPRSEVNHASLEGSIYPVRQVIIKSVLYVGLFSAFSIITVVFILSLFQDGHIDFNNFKSIYWEEYPKFALLGFSFGILQGLIQGILFSLFRFKLVSPRHYVILVAIGIVAIALIVFSLVSTIKFQNDTWKFITFWAILGFVNVLIAYFVLPKTSLSHTDNAP